MARTNKSKGIPSHPRHCQHHPLQTIGMDRKGGKSGQRESPMAPHSTMAQQPNEKSRKAGTRSPKFPRGSHCKGHPQLASRCLAPGVDPCHKEGASPEHCHCWIVVDGHSRPAGGQTRGEPKLTQLPRALTICRSKQQLLVSCSNNPLHELSQPSKVVTAHHAAARLCCSLL